MKAAASQPSLIDSRFSHRHSTSLIFSRKTEPEDRQHPFMLPSNTWTCWDSADVGWGAVYIVLKAASVRRPSASWCIVCTAWYTHRHYPPPPPPPTTATLLFTLHPVLGETNGSGGWTRVAHSAHRGRQHTVWPTADIFVHVYGSSWLGKKLWNQHFSLYVQRYII